MKINNIFKSATLVAMVGALSACSSDYLDLSPETTVGTDQVTSTVEAAQLAINSMCNAMQTQYSGWSSNGYNCMNGESALNCRYFEALGQDDQYGLGQQMWGYEAITGGSVWQKDNYVLNALPWEYCYNLITQANTILAGIDDAEGEDNERSFVKAQALTFRAHAYIKLVQFYAPRFEDSRNMEVKCAVLRTEAGTADVPLCTMKEMVDLIYSDLNDAIELYKASELNREYKWQPDLGVAYGLLSRIAMIVHDYETAQDAAHNARTGYSIMDNNTYLSGFMNDNNDFMWVSADDPSDIYYWSFGAFSAVNGTYVKNWMLGAGAIDYEFYKTMDARDIRRKCFLTPDKIEVLEDVMQSYNPGKITAADWWNPNLVNESQFCNLATGPYAKKDAKDGKYGLYNVAVFYSYYYANNIFTGDISSMGNADDDGKFVAYYTSSNKGAVRISKSEYGTLTTIPFGAQYKFWSNPPYGVSKYPFMRSAEMALTEAEAAYHNGETAVAQKIVENINKMRYEDDSYSCTATGQALLDEIRLCRRAELWGEGFSWPDFKRWNLPIVRKAWVANDPTSGNWMLQYGVDTPAKKNGGWRMLIPASEYKFNKAIDRNEIEANVD